MSRVARILGAVVVALATTALVARTAVAGSDRERYEAAVKKVALPFGSFFNGPPRKLSKGLCVCISDDLVGVLETIAGTGASPPSITCTRYFFNPDGSVAAAIGCGDWTPLTK
jgi:hypothetical protein